MSSLRIVSSHVGRKTRLHLFLVLLGVISASLFLANRAFGRLWPTTHGYEVTAMAQGQTPARRALTLLPIQFRFNGCYPKEFSGAAGKYELLIINATGQPDLTVQMEKDHGEGAQTLNQQHGRNLRSVQNLQEGDYILNVPDRPDLSCELHISGQ